MPLFYYNVVLNTTNASLRPGSGTFTIGFPNTGDQLGQGVYYIRFSAMNLYSFTVNGPSATVVFVPDNTGGGGQGGVIVGTQANQPVLQAFMNPPPHPAPARLTAFGALGGDAALLEIYWDPVNQTNTWSMLLGVQARIVQVTGTITFDGPYVVQ
jgi:hypothetical protein